VRSLSPEALAERLNPRLDVLRRFPLFSFLADEELEDLGESAVALRAGSGETLFRQGDAAEHMFLIVSGSIRLSSTGAGDLEHPIALQGPESCFGEMGFLDEGPRSATAVAARPTELLRIGRDDLNEVLARHEGARERFLLAALRLVSSRLRAANERYWNLAAKGRVAKADEAQSRSRLASLVSHEFRTPLTIIKSSAQRLRMALKEEESLLAAKIEQQCSRLESLIDDLIALSLLQSSSAPSEAGEFDLTHLAAEVVAEASRQAQAKGLRLSMARADEEVVISADRVLLRRALRHLVHNAIKFSTAGDVVVEASGIDGEWCRLRVRDQGIGIEGRALERLTASFVQEQSPLNREVDGLGIGLALAKEVARVHGGRLVVESRLGFGSSFALELPRTGFPDAGAASRTSPEEGAIDDE